MLSFGVSVAVNNLLALRAFYTFLFNYQLHEKPSFLERKLIPVLRAWTERKAMATLAQLLTDPDAKLASVSLNDVSGDFFAVLYAIQNAHLLANITNGKDCFLLLAQMSLEFEKVKHPRNGTVYTPQL